ncbi:GNAT family N-acetyltransferase [Dactylosporangium sp. McL0621]|uniref:GNAT family N-acetyltransferase n=1 Tax=Dactylosporangium sp. McL0621 TaxID=3415678 RepID=UPI003CF675C2
MLTVTSAADAAPALPWLLRDPVRNTVPGAVLSGGPLPAATRLLLARDGGGDVHGVAFLAPGRAWFVASGSPAGAAAIGAHLRDAGPLRADGLDEDVEAFRCGGTVVTRTRLYALGELVPPRGVPGELSPVTAADRDIAVAWVREFGEETGTGGEGAEAAVDKRLAVPGRCWFWRVGGEPVSFLWLTVPFGGVVRLSAVCTPRELRGRGYASACVAAASAHALAGGARRCVLYTDLTNPLSNRIYTRLGYEPVADGGIRSFE